MNCEQIREAMNTDNHNGLVLSHLNTCHPCRQHEAELSSLLSLLSGQPRVQAPADFDARLQARLASEEVQLLALVNSLPAVEAPADFDFRLRARMAQAKAGNQTSNPLAWLGQFWGRSFSFGQAATAMAVIALLVTFSVKQFNHSGNQEASSNSATIAKVEISKLESASNFVPVPAPVERKNAKSFQVSSVKSVAHAPRQLMPAANFESAKVQALEPALDGKLVASNLAEQSVINAKTRQELKLARSGYGYGQQYAKFAAAAKAEPITVAF